jgi:hypothetical protein
VKTNRSKSWLFPWQTQRAKRRRPAPLGRHFRRPWRLEELENRVLPTVIDLTTAGASGMLNGAIFSQFTPNPAGSGAFDSFVRLSSNNAVEQGYNTDFRPVQFDENNSSSFTHSLQLGSVPTVTLNGKAYYEFELDINQSTSAGNLLSLDSLRFYVTNSSIPNPSLLNKYDPTTHALVNAGTNPIPNPPGPLSPVYDLNPTDDGGTYIKLDGNLSPGTGKADMIAFIPVATFGGASPSQYVYLYSKFGVNWANTSGFEQWAANLVQVGSISGTAYQDSTGNGSFSTKLDSNNPNYVPVTVQLLLGSTVVATTTTDTNGNYTFPVLNPGTYTITQVNPNGWIRTAEPAPIVFTSGQNATGENFALFEAAPPVTGGALKIATPQTPGGSLTVADNNSPNTNLNLNGQNAGSFPTSSLQNIQITVPNIQTLSDDITVDTTNVNSNKVTIHDGPGNNTYKGGKSGTTIFVNNHSTESISVTGGTNALNFSTNTFGVTFDVSLNNNQTQTLDPTDTTPTHFLSVLGTFQSFVGSNSNDVFSASTGTVSNLSFDGGLGTDTFMADGANITGVSFSGEGADTFIASSGIVNNVSFNGGPGADAFIVDGGDVTGVSFSGGDSGDSFVANGGTVSNVSFDGGSGSDVFIANGASNVSNISFDGGGGNDSFIAEAGIVTNVSFDGTGSDTFIAEGANVTGVSFSGGDLGDTFIANGGTVSNVSFDGGAAADVFIADGASSVSNISFDGGAGNDAFIADSGTINNVSFNGDSGVDSFVVDGANTNVTGVSFDGTGTDNFTVTDGGTVTNVSFIGGSADDAFVADNANVSAVSYDGGGGSDSFTANNSTLNNVTFNGGPGPGSDYFALEGGTASNVLFNGKSNDVVAAVGGTMTTSTLVGGPGSNRFLFFGNAQGSITIQAGSSATNSVDFSSFTGPLNSTTGITFDSTTQALQTVYPPSAGSPLGLKLTLSNPQYIQNVIGTRFNDTIYGNSQPNDVLAGAAIPDVRSSSASSMVSVAQHQTFWLDFSVTTGHNYANDNGVDERPLIQSILQADFAPFGFITFTTTQPASLPYGTIKFNVGAGPGGVDSEIDPRNLDLNSVSTLQVNGFLGGPGQPPATSQNWVLASAGIAGHEAEHALATDHYDAFGPPGFGIGAFPGAGTFNPTYPGPEAGFETTSHLMASPASVGSSLFDLVAPPSGPFIGEREAVKIAFDEFATPPPLGPTGTVIQSSGAAHSIATAQAAPLIPIPVPNTVPFGAFDYGKELDVAAVDVVGFLQPPPPGLLTQSDYYAIPNCKKGDLLNLEAISQLLIRPAPNKNTAVMDTVLHVYDSLGNPVPYYGSTAFNDDQDNVKGNELADSRIIDLRLPADGTYYVQVSGASIPTGNYELFMYRFAATNSKSGSDKLVGLGANTTFQIGTDGNNTLVGGSGTNTVQVSGGTSYQLSNSTLTVGTSTNNLTNIQNAVLTGLNGTTFDLRGWSGTSTLNAVVNGVVGNNPIVTPHGVAINAVEGQAFAGQAAATFTDAGAPVASYTDSINWGDNSSSSGSFSANGSQVTVTGGHTFQEEGSYPVTTTFKQGTAFTVIVGGTATVTDAPLTPVTITPPPSPLQGILTTLQVASFTDANTSAPVSDFTASISWGDGTTSTGTVSQPGGLGTAFVVKGSHAYGTSGSVMGTVTINDKGGASTTSTFTMTVTPSIIVLNQTASGALTLAGSSGISIPGAIFVNSNSPSALNASGKSSITASTIQVVGGTKISSNVNLSTQPMTGVAPITDPLAGLQAPTGVGNLGALNLTSGTMTIGTNGTGPFVYSQISVSGNGTKLIMNPGVYIITSGGFSVTNSASVSGNGVMIYLAGGAIGFGSSANVSLHAATTATAADPYPGILLFQARTNTSTLSLSASSALGFTGTIYAPAALLSLGGSSTFADPAIVNLLSVNGNGGTLPMLAAGAPPRPGDSVGLFQPRNLFLYVNDPAGVLTADEHARLQDAIRAWNTALVPFHVAITEVSTAAAANLFLDTGPTSLSGGSDDGVLGSYTPATVGSDITIVQGWNWYTGSDPTAIAAGQYDFQTVLTHELGHVLGLGHSPDASSAMFAFLAPSVAHRTPTVADISGASPTPAEDRPSTDQSPTARLDPALVGALLNRETTEAIASTNLETSARADQSSASAGFTGRTVADLASLVPEARPSGRAQPILQSGQMGDTDEEDAPFGDVACLSDVGGLWTIAVGPGLLPAPVPASEQVRLAALTAVLQERAQTAPAPSPGLDSVRARSVSEGQEYPSLTVPARTEEPSPWLSGLLILSLVGCTPAFLDRKDTDRYFAELGARGSKGSDEPAH